MNKESLLEKRAATEARFSELQQEQTKTNEELIRLQGEYRTLTTLINELPEEITKTKGK
jgi:peptidoglycan hydrolase CwlO-like protein